MKKNKTKKENKNKVLNDNMGGGGIIVALFTFLFSLLFYHNTFFYRSSIQNIDNFIFYNCSYFIDRGLIVYKDFIDNKGPILYLINYFEYKFDNIHMVYYVTLLLHFITNLYVYKIARLKLNVKKSILVLVFTNAFLISMLEEHLGSLTGTMCEFYAMPIFSYLYYRYLKDKNYKKNDFIIFGMLFSVLLFLRVNLVSISVITIVLILYKYYKHNKIGLIMKYLSCFILGALIIALPIILYFIKNNAITEMIDSYILFNIKYSSLSSNSLPFINKMINYIMTSFKTFVDFTKNIFILSILCIYITDIITKKRINENFIILIFCYFMAIFISNKFYMHYIWVLMPLASVPFSLLFDKNNIKKEYLSMFILIAIASMFFVLYALKHNYIEKRNDKGFSDNYYEMVNAVKKITNDNINSKIFGAINLNNHFYKDTNLLPSGNYILQYDQKFMYDEFTNKFKDKLPEIVVYEKYKKAFSEDYKLFLEYELNNNYILEYKDSIYQVYKLKG